MSNSFTVSDGRVTLGFIVTKAGKLEAFDAAKKYIASFKRNERSAAVAAVVAHAKKRSAA